MGSLMQGFREDRRPQATLQTAEDRQTQRDQQESAIERAIADVPAHRAALARFYRDDRRAKGALGAMVPDLEYISVAVKDYRSVVLVKSASKGWLHAQFMGVWRLEPCRPVEVGERTYPFGYHLVPTP